MVGVVFVSVSVEDWYIETGPDFIENPISDRIDFTVESESSFNVATGFEQFGVFGFFVVFDNCVSERLTEWRIT